MDLSNNTSISEKINRGEPVSLSFTYPSEPIIRSLNSLFAKILSKLDMIYMIDTTITILREIIINAFKANAKRVYFEKNSIDITDPSSYQEGISRFKNEVVGNLDFIEADMKSSRYNVIITIKNMDKGLQILVTNNTPILPEELERIRLRMARAREYNDFSDAYEEVYDSTEGAGLGIVLVTLLLKNSGVDLDTYQINSDGKVTRCQLLIPFQLRPIEIVTNIKKQIIEQVMGLPTFPEHIIELQRMCNDPDSSISVISKKIMIDPSLTSDVIKLSNSASFITNKRVENVNEAVMNIGLNNLNMILTASSARRILDKRFSKFEQVWNHCNKVATYTSIIATKLKIAKVMENAFISGLLHDLGKIVLLSTNLELTNRVADIVNNRKIRTSTVLEEISIGISHSTIGEMIAQKWNFPEYLTEAIKYHHSPLCAKKEYEDLVNITYLANMLCGIENRKYDYYYIEEEILKKYNLPNLDDFNKFHEDIQNSFNSSNSQ